MRTTIRASAALAVVLLMGACGTDSAEDATSPPPTGQTTSPTAEPSTPEPATPEPSPTDRPGSEPADRPPEVTAAVADLATHLGIDPADVLVVSYEDVTWPDGALGCPQPGMSYTQALVPGSRLVLEVDAVEYAYHAGREPDLVRCDNPQPPVDTQQY